MCSPLSDEVDLRLQPYAKFGLDIIDDRPGQAGYFVGRRASKVDQHEGLARMHCGASQ